jgi:hypothetical protein
MSILTYCNKIRLLIRANNEKKIVLTYERMQILQYSRQDLHFENIPCRYVSKVLYKLSARTQVLNWNNTG